MSLDRYKQKRDFKVTPEPAGKPVHSRGRLRYVIQKHAASRLHYDFRLELGGVLLSWAVPKGPSLNPADRRLAVHVEDHPVDYGGFEGTIPAGEYGGGNVIVWDRGQWIPEGDDPAADYAGGNLKFRLEGEKLHGGFALVRMHGRRDRDKDDNWLLLKHRDEDVDADGERVVRERPESVISGLTVEEIAAGPAKRPRKTTTKVAAGKTTIKALTKVAAGKTTSKAATRKSASKAATKITSKAATRKSASKATTKVAARKTTSKAATKVAARKTTTKTATKTAARKTTSKAATKTAARSTSKAAAQTAPRKTASRTTARGKTTAPARVAHLVLDDIAPELATLVDAVPPGPDWLHEVKYDGYRLLARIDGDAVRLLTRRGEDWSARFPWLIEALRARVSTPAAILDGELVHLGADGVTRFGELQRALSEGKHEALVYFAFDLLQLGDQDLRPLPLEQRKQALAGLLPAQATPGRVRLSEHIIGQGEPLFTRACRLGLEGVISKRRTAPYRAGRFRDWVKVKCGQRQEVVIGAFTPARSGGRDIGALLLGVHNDAGELVYCGKVGTGFDFAGATDLRARLERLKTASNPFTRRPPGLARTVFVRPELVAEIGFTDWTRDGRMRHPVFEGLREDKKAADVHRERTEPVAAPTPTRATAPATTRPRKAAARAAKAGSGADPAILGLTLSHPDRLLFPADGISKRDLAEYYAAVAPAILPWIAGRPLSVVRCPDSIDKPCFFQKHIHHELPPGLRTADLDDGGSEAPYLYVEDARGLVGLVQVGTIELHIWGSTVARPDAPDRVVLDLDPDGEVPWARVKETAQALHSRLADLGLVSFLKTTGGKGLHVVVPLTAGKQTWDQVKAFARGIAGELVRAAPGLFTANASKAGRAGKIYIDYLRNYRGSTSVAPYSVRARPGAPVSVPLAWEELAALKSSQVFTLKNLSKRLTSQSNNVSDPWRDLPTVQQSLDPGLLRTVTRR